MSDPLTIHVNRTALYSLDLPDSFESAESFDVRLVNHGEATHVHLHIDDALSEIARIEAPNHHLETDSERRVRVTLTRDGRARGNLKVVTGYGATTRYVTVTVTETDVSTEPVEVGEELARPQPSEPPTATERVTESPYLAPAVGAVVLLLVALSVAAVFQSPLVLVAGVVLAVSGLAAAVFIR